MSGATLVEEILFYLDLATLIGLILRLVTSGLYQTYKLFFAFVATVFVGEFVFVFLKAGTNAYGWCFVGLEAVRVVFSAVIILDLYSLVLRDLPGLSRIARRYISVVLGISILVSLLLLSLEQYPSTILFKYYVFYRAISTSLVLFLLFITAFLVYYPIPLARNVIVYTVGYAVYFLVHAAGFLLLTTGGTNQPWREPVNNLLQIVSVATIVYWTIFLNRAGETKIRSAVSKLSSQQQRELLQKLEAVNASVLRMAKK